MFPYLYAASPIVVQVVPGFGVSSVHVLPGFGPTVDQEVPGAGTIVS